MTMVIAARPLGKTVIVTRHQGLVEWLQEHGIVGKTLRYAEPADVAGQHVIGSLPVGWLSASARTITVIDFPDLDPDMRGASLTAKQMDIAGARLREYVVLTADEAEAIRRGLRVVPPGSLGGQDVIDWDAAWRAIDKEPQ